MAKGAKKKADKIVKKAERFWSLLGQSIDASLDREEGLASFEMVLESLDGPDEHIRVETERDRKKYLSLYRGASVSSHSGESGKRVSANRADIADALGKVKPTSASIFQTLYRFDDIYSIAKQLVSDPMAVEPVEIQSLCRPMLSLPTKENDDIQITAILWSYTVLESTFLSFEGTLLSHIASSDHFCFHALAYLGYWKARLVKNVPKAQLDFLVKICHAKADLLVEIEDWQIILMASFWLFLDDGEALQNLVVDFLLSKSPGISQKQICRTLEEDIQDIFGSSFSFKNKSVEVVDFVKYFFSSKEAVSCLTVALEKRLDRSAKQPDIEGNLKSKALKSPTSNSDGEDEDEAPISFEIDKFGDTSLIEEENRTSEKKTDKNKKRKHKGDKEVKDGSTVAKKKRSK